MQHAVCKLCNTHLSAAVSAKHAIIRNEYLYTLSHYNYVHESGMEFCNLELLPTEIMAPSGVTLFLRSNSLGTTFLWQTTSTIVIYNCTPDIDDRFIRLPDIAIIQAHWPVRI